MLNRTPLKLGSKYIVLLAMAYVTVMLAADIVAYKFTSFFGLVESGATILFPFTYLLGDVITEVYGWDTAMKIVWLGLFCEAVFAILITLVIHIHSYRGIGAFQGEYIDILGNICLFVFSGIIANMFAGLLNIYLISKWKVLINGTKFWLRSILSTCISEFVLILITVFIAFPSSINIHNTMHVFRDAYFLEMLYALIFVLPAQGLVMLLKRAEGIDAYDYGIKYNPFKFNVRGVE